MGLISPEVRQLDSGLWIVAPSDTGQLLSPATAQLALTIPAGAMDDRPGLATLVAETLIEDPAGIDTRRSLRRAIADQAGTLAIQVGAHSTTFVLEIPNDRWQSGLAALFSAITASPGSQAQLDRIRQQVLSRFSDELDNDLLRVTIERLLAGDVERAAYLESFTELDIADVQEFHRLHYRPVGSVLGILVPGLSGEDVLQYAGQVMGPWRSQLTTARSLEPRNLQTGIYWSPGELPCRLAVILTQPDPWAPQAAEVRLLQECTTMSGFGGRLERALDQVGAGGFLFTARVIHREGVRHVILEGEIDPAQVPALWKILQDVRTSYSGALPSDSELQFAARRVHLIALTDQANPRLWLETAMWQVMRQRQPGPPIEFLTKVNDPAALDMRVGAAALQNQSMAMVVVGGRPGAVQDLPLVQLPELRPISDPVEVGDPAAHIAAAEPHLQRALQAVGGPDRVRTVSGYSTVGTTTPEMGPPFADQLWVAAERMRRVRRVLATTIETVVTPDESYELSGSERRELDERERRTIMLDAHRHPLMLLAAHARGELKFRLVSVREVVDREMVILEAVDSRFERLRFHIDSGSGLVRQIETWQSSPNAEPVYVRESYSDYRSISGIRVPFHRLTDLDDGAHRQRTTWGEFVPGRPGDNLLRPSRNQR